MMSIKETRKNPQLLFFIGKGGVGKSTTSALTSVYLASKSYNTLLVSMDPAHNQCDIFEQDFSEKPKKVSDTLMVKEVNSDFWIEKYLKETTNQIKDTYKYESAFNLQNYFNVLQFSPGLEEYALLLAFEDTLHKYGDRDFIVFDMAPTALTLRFFSLPFITLIWLEELLTLRSEIYRKKEIISKIKIAGREIEQDGVKAKLQSLIGNYEHLRQHFMAGTTKVNLVMNNDKLSFSEAFRIRQKLLDINIAINRIVINKVEPSETTEKIENEFKAQKFSRFPFLTGGLSGYAALMDYIAENAEAFRNI
ncbi:MAG: TRC40/GET3/ArsA family transport-energizing ATPase [Desulfobacterales bacterium]|jgi:arsenite-transporting ATPase